MPEVWNAKEVAEYLKISEQLVYKAARAGDIPCFKVGGRILFNKDKIVRIVEGDTGEEQC